MKIARGKYLNPLQWNSILTADISTATWKQKENGIPINWKNITDNLEFYIQRKYPQEWKRNKDILRKKTKTKTKRHTVRYTLKEIQKGF